MGVILSTKTINPVDGIQCDELATVTLALTATPDIATNPVDIMLVLDRSGSMDPAMPDLKTAAIDFVDIIKEATNPGGTDLGGNSRIGLVSFASSANLDVALTQDVSDLNAAINGLSAIGNTNTASAFTLATANYTPVLSPPNKKVLVIMTDGNPNAPSPDPTGAANAAAAAAKAAGIEIYAIGLGNGIDQTNLNNWSSDPDSSHVVIAPTPAELAQAFQDLAANINKPGAVGITVVDTVEDEFEIVGSPVLDNPPTTSADAIVDPSGKFITWTLDELGVNGSETATVTFSVRYLACVTATLPLNRSVTYADQNTPPSDVTFIPNITDITVDCDADVIPDCCDEAQDVTYDPCETVLDVDLPASDGYYDLLCTGRLLKLAVRLRNVCPDRRVAIGVIVTEVINGVEYSRGFKAITAGPVDVPRDTCPCSGVIVSPVTFVFPEGLDTDSTLCSTRVFRIRIVAHYIDTGIADFDICPVIPPAPNNS